mmetsp:Transcript_24554/g.21794  ORF Transcript_24554/g.21794 Transcript_24554/m.21794 type:complete len:154 (+) Transcript_24554:421-882(+)
MIKNGEFEKYTIQESASIRKQSRKKTKSFSSGLNFSIINVKESISTKNITQMIYENKHEKRCLILGRHMIIGLDEIESGKMTYKYGIKAISASSTVYYINIKDLRLSHKTKSLLSSQEFQIPETKSIKRIKTNHNLRTGSKMHKVRYNSMTEK